MESWPECGLTIESELIYVIRWPRGDTAMAAQAALRPPESCHWPPNHYSIHKWLTGQRWDL